MASSDVDYSGYGWIKIKRYVMDESLPWEERYHQLERHHLEETTFLIDKVRELAEEIQQMQRADSGQ